MAKMAEQGYTGGELTALNLCRLYLQVTSLSEVTNGRGTFILQERKPRKSNQYKWPVQGDPTTAMWKEWDIALQRCFGNDTLELNQPLGPWDCTEEEYYKWEWFVGTDGNLYQKKENYWVPYKEVQNSRTRRRRFIKDTGKEPYNQPPCRVHRTTTRKNGPYYTHTGIQK